MVFLKTEAWACPCQRSMRKNTILKLWRKLLWKSLSITNSMFDQNLDEPTNKYQSDLWKKLLWKSLSITNSMSGESLEGYTYGSTIRYPLSRCLSLKSIIQHNDCGRREKKERKPYQSSSCGRAYQSRRMQCSNYQFSHSQRSNSYIEIKAANLQELIHGEV